MAITCAIDAANRLATGTVSGTVSGADISSAFREIYEHPLWQPDFDLLWDCTTITQLLLETNDLSGLVALHRDFAGAGGTGRQVIAVTRPLDHVMAKTYEIMMRAQGKTVHVCRSKAQAARYLGRAV